MSTSTDSSAVAVQHGMPATAEGHVLVANASERTAPRAPQRGRMVMWIALPMAADDLFALGELVERLWPGATISNHDGGYAIREAVR